MNPTCVLNAFPSEVYLDGTKEILDVGIVEALEGPAVQFRELDVFRVL